MKEIYVNIKNLINDKILQEREEENVIVISAQDAHYLQTLNGFFVTQDGKYKYKGYGVRIFNGTDQKTE